MGNSWITQNLGRWTNDADETAFFERELMHMYAKTYDIKYPELKARLYVPVSNEANPGSTEVNYKQFDRVGKAKLTAPGAVDSPRVDVLGKEFIRPVRLATASYGWHLLEVRQAAMAGRPLETRKSSAARRAVEEVLDEVAAIGAPDFGIPTGFLNSAAVTIDAAAGAWSAATADVIIADVSQMLQNMATNTQGIERINTLLLPDAQWAVIATLPRSAQSDTTVLEFLLKSFPGLQRIEPWYRLTTAGAGGIPRAVAYDLSPDVLTQEIPSEFEQLPLFQKGQNFVVETMATTAGTALYYPRAIRYLDGL
ncbi:hypothetical protein LCGC14_2158160 [marine sediment metagenome]|uniref:Bacteriophage Mu GpT domain-containing protein n=1 Tax=marine sediment metagenome TaxID=412755 RepID=A0A0F9GPM7_9ZZZZ